MIEPTPHLDPGDWISLDEAATLAGVAKSTIWRRFRNGSIAGREESGRILISRTTLRSHRSHPVARNVAKHSPKPRNATPLQGVQPPDLNSPSAIADPRDMQQDATPFDHSNATAATASPPATPADATVPVQDVVRPGTDIVAEPPHNATPLRNGVALHATRDETGVPLERYEAAVMRLGWLEGQLDMTRRMLTDGGQREAEMRQRIDAAEQEALAETLARQRLESELQQERERRRQLEARTGPWWRRWFST